MKLRGVVSEDFSNYSKPSLFLISTTCDWKCCAEHGLDASVCQNASLVSQPIVDYSNSEIYNAFADNDITKAVVVGGLEPFIQFQELLDLIAEFRFRHNEECDFVIYTGYYQNEIQDSIDILSCIENIVIKFGRYIPNSEPKYDEVLGVTLASDNQFARRIS